MSLVVQVRVYAEDMTTTQNIINPSDIIEGETYIVTKYMIDEPRKKMQVTIIKVTDEYVTAETKVVESNGYRKQTHIGLSTWPASLIAEWTFVEVSK